MARARWLLLAPTVVVVAACGSSGGNVIRTGGATSAATSSSASSSPASSTASSSTAATGKPTVTVSPSRGLTNGQNVTVTAAGFRPNEPLVIVQCADKGNATGAGDCNLTAMQTLTSDAKGGLVARVPVARGPFGANGVTCSAKQACLFSVNPATPAPTEEASAPISFAG